MKILSYIFTVLSIIGATMAANCERNIACLAKNAQITFIGQVMQRENITLKSFSAVVQPLCTMYGLGESKIADEEYSRTITISGFGNHAGGTCQADVGEPGEIDIFFVHVNNTVPRGGVRTFGLTDPCYGAFLNDTTNFVELAKLTYGQLGYNPSGSPLGSQCPILSKDNTNNKININGVSYDMPIDLTDDKDQPNFGLDDDVDSGSPKNYVISTTLIVFVAFLLQLFF